MTRSRCCSDGFLILQSRIQTATKGLNAELQAINLSELESHLSRCKNSSMVQSDLTQFRHTQRNLMSCLPENVYRCLQYNSVVCNHSGLVTLCVHLFATYIYHQHISSHSHISTLLCTGCLVPLYHVLLLCYVGYECQWLSALIPRSDSG